MSDINFSEVIWKAAIPIDVRAPKEFEKGHIEGAINIPILDDINRSKVGTAYKQRGQQPAIEVGLELASPHFLTIYQQLKKIEIEAEAENKKILIYCARGGMRSGIVYQLMSSLNIKCDKLIGGYKAYRNEILEVFEKSIHQFRFLIVNGYTGSGKTVVLNKLEEAGGFTIDLEGLAHHAGSVFGHIPFGERQTITQQQFESHLAHRILVAQQQAVTTIFLEGESKRIGKVLLPAPFFAQMKSADTVIIDRPLQERIDLIIEQYAPGSPWFMEALFRIKRQLGDERYRALCVFIEQENYQAVIEELLTGYYDRCYLHAMGEKKGIVTTIVGTDEEMVQQLLTLQ